MGTRRVIATDRAPKAIGPYSQGIFDEASGLLVCAGQIGLDPSTGEMVPGGVVEQFRRAAENALAVVAAAGLGPADVLRVTLFLADMADFQAVNTAYADYFQPPYPARSTVAALGLPRGARVELELTALRGA